MSRCLSLLSAPRHLSRVVLLLLTLCWVAIPPGLNGAASNGVTGPRLGQWAHETSSLKPDPAVTFGRLDNGLRYALLPHNGVKGRVTMWLVVLAGSMDETDQELGIAHYIEHLAFRTSRNFSGEEKIAFFQRLGMEAGSDVNAHTSRDHTAYKLEFRESTPALLDHGLLLFRDIADGVIFKTDELEQERGVIVSEWRRGESIMEKGGLSSGHTVFKGLRFPDRDPIGKPEVFRTFTKETFENYYRRCYRSDQMIAVAAGDFDGAQLEQMIQAKFADMQKPSAPPPARDEGRLDTARGLRAGVYRITDVGSASATVACVTPAPDRPDSRAAREDFFRRQFAMALFNARVGKATGGSGGASYMRLWGHDTAMINADITSDTWPRDLGILDDLVRFTWQRGFEQREIDMLKRREIPRIDFMLEQRQTIDPSYLCEALATSVTDHEVYLGFEQTWQAEREWYEKLTARDLQAAFQSCWDLERMSYHIAGDVEIEGGGAEVIKKVQQDRKGGMRYFRPDTRKEAKFELKKWGTPTTVVESRTVPELGAKLMRFGNNVRVNYARSQSESGLVHIVARIGSGLLEMPDDRPALKEFGLQTVLAGGSTNYTVEQIGEIIEDHLAGFAFDVDDMDAFAFRGLAATDKIEICLGLMADYLYKPSFGSITHREQKFGALITGLLSRFGMGEGMRELHNYLFKGDARFTYLGDPKDYLGLSVNDVRDWLQEPLARGYLEVTIVGDISEDAVVNAVSRTLGSLPTRAEKKILTYPPKPLKVSAPPGFQRIEFIGEQHLAEVIGNWPVQSSFSTKDRATLEVLVKILEQRIWHDVRATLGLAYSPSADFTPYIGFPNFALMQAAMDCDPNEATRVARLVEDLADKLAQDGATEMELVGARGILSGQVRQWFNSAGFLISLLPRAQERPETLDEAVALRNGLIDQITLEDINTWARKILPRKNSRTAAIVPKQFIGVFQTDSP